VKGPAWGASTGEIAHNAPSPPARDGLGAALRQRQRRQDLLTSAGSVCCDGTEDPFQLQEDPFQLQYYTM